MSATMELHINDVSYCIDADPARSLLNFLREDLDLTGSKPGCGEGECGACTVLIDGHPVRSCITLVGDAVGKQVTTIEGLEQDGRLHPLQAAFLEVDAMQCSYCTAGMIMSGAGLLQTNSEPTLQEIIGFMEGNICRCGTYPRIIAAIRTAAMVLKEGSDERDINIK